MRQEDFRRRLHHDDFREWVSVDPQSREKAFCKFCKKIVDIGNMGEAALVNHMSRKKHKAAAEVARSTASVASFRSGSLPSVASASSCRPNPSRQSLSPAASPGFFGGTETPSTEVMWTLNVVSKHYSFRSCEDVSSLDRAMFPDSQIASSFQWG